MCAHRLASTRLTLLATAVAMSFLVSSAAAQESLTVRFDTSPTPNPQFGTENIVAVWIEDNLGNYIQTIARWSDNDNHRRYLYDWLAASNRPNTNPVPDGYQGGTLTDYQNGLMVTWDFSDPSAQLVPDGSYVVRMELADRNGQSSAENNVASFAFDKNGTSSQVTGASGGFGNVTIDYVAPDALDCGNGTIDPGETCEGSDCPTNCEPTGDVCMVNSLRGDAALCTAECVVAEVTMCVDGDGCCPAGCGNMDSDCAGSGNIGGSCSAAGGLGGGAWLVLIGLALCARRRSGASRC